jgi:tetratricopeptide (TPR) repeat protein
VELARGVEEPFCLTIALASHGVLLLALGELDAAHAALEESAERGRQAHDAWAVALPLRNLAIIACRRGEYDRARRLLEESLHGLRDLGERWFVSRSIETLAQVLVAQEEHDRAARLFGAAEGLREAVGASVLAIYRADYDHAIASARKALGPRVFERCWEEGRRQTSDTVVAYALSESIARLASE